MTKSTEKSKLKGKKVNVVGRRGVSKATKGSFLPLEHENSIEEKESESNSSKPVLEEEASRSSGAKGASRRKAHKVGSYSRIYAKCGLVEQKDALGDHY